MAKLYATVNAKEEAIVLERTAPSAPWTPADENAADLVRTGPSTFSLVRNGRSHRVLVLKEDNENGSVRLRIGVDPLFDRHRLCGVGPSGGCLFRLGPWRRMGFRRPPLARSPR